MVGNFLENRIYSMAIIVDDTKLMAICFWLLWEFLIFIYFLKAFRENWREGFKRSLQLVTVRCLMRRHTWNDVAALADLPFLGHSQQKVSFSLNVMPYQHFWWCGIAIKMKHGRLWLMKPGAHCFQELETVWKKFYLIQQSTNHRHRVLNTMTSLQNNKMKQAALSK